MNNTPRDPRDRFDTPEQVVDAPELTLREKVEILRRWEYDASEAQVAEEEGMPGGGGDLLRRVLLALDRLTGGVDLERVGPTKQHGLPSGENESG